MPSTTAPRRSDAPGVRDGLRAFLSAYSVKDGDLGVALVFNRGERLGR